MRSFKWVELAKWRSFKLMRFPMLSGKDVTDLQFDKSSVSRDVSVEIPSELNSSFSHPLKLRCVNLLTIFLNTPSRIG